jgi:stringent starvation protein B
MEVMLTLLRRAEASVHLDARRPGVVLPERLLGQGHLRLDYGYGFDPPIPDLVVDERGIAATLSFNRLPAATFVPWAAVFLIADFDGKGVVWHEDMPSDLVERLPPPKPALAPVAEVPARPAGPPAKPPRPSHLKLVK